MNMKIFKFFIANIFIVASLFVPSFVFAGTPFDFEYTINPDAVSVTITSYTGEDGHVDIPSSISEGEDVYAVTAIGPWAFAGKTGITSVLIPNTVTSIGPGAFYGTGLTSVNIPSSVTSIEARAFSDTSLTSVVIPNSVTSIGEDAFPALETLTIGSGIKEINQRILNPIDNLTNLTLSEGLEKIGSAVFMNASNLESVVIPNTVTSIGGVAFYGTKLTSVIIPDSVTSLEAMTFPDTVETLVVGSGIKKIESPITASYKLTSLTLSEGLEEVFGAFSSTNISSLIIPSSVKKIGGFTWSSNLTSIDLPEGLEEILSNAFSGTPFTRIVIPEDVTTLGDYVFADNESLSEVYFKGNAPSSVGLSPFGISEYSEVTPPVVTVYYYEGKAGFGSTWNGHNTVMLTKPTVVNLDVSNIGTKTVKINASLTSSDNSMNLTTKRGFQYGLTSSYGSTFEELSAGYASGNFSTTLNNLQCGTTYHFRAYATSDAGTSYGSDATFKTERCPTRVTGSRAVLRPVVSPTTPSNQINPSTGDSQAKDDKPSNHVPFVYKKIIKQGLRGDDVKQVQNYLLSKGYSLGLVDGVFGPKTKQAVMAFQKSHNLKADGIIGPLTIQKINEIK